MTENWKTVSFKCPPALVEALEAVAAEGYCSVSHAVRQTILKSFREAGLLDLVGDDISLDVHMPDNESKRPFEFKVYKKMESAE